MPYSAGGDAKYFTSVPSGTAGSRSARCMNVFQIIAGYVPPATGSPWNWFVIGTSLFG